MRKALVVVGIVVLAFNLRPAAVSVGPVLADVQHGLGMGPFAAGVLTSLPVVAFAGVGALAPRLARLVGLHRLSLIALVAVVAGLWLRTTTDSVPLFLLLSLLGLAGMATANVLLPSLVKLHFPDHVGVMTAVYSTSLAVGLAAAAVLTVPVAQAYDGWRSGLAVWAITAAIAALPWIGLVGHDRRPEETRGGPGLLDVARTRLGWWMALFFGLQSMQAYAIFGWFAQVYRDDGFSASTAGLLLGAITGISIPLSFIVPAAAARLENQSVLMWTVMACYPVGYLGLAFGPGEGDIGWALVWAFLVGIGMSTFPLILTLIGLRARSTHGTAALSGFTQAAGYLLAVVGPFGVGLLHDLSGGWALPLVALTLVNVPQLVAGLAVARPAFVEDELESATTSAPRSRVPPS